MIDTSELRLNNWIQIGKRPHQVESLSYGIVNIIGEDELGGFAGYYSEECNPILLTPEILEAAGFIIPEGEVYFIHTSEQNTKHAQLRMVFASNNWTVSIGNDRTGIVFCILKYLHQLQNLYFALTSEELEIKLPQLAQNV